LFHTKILNNISKFKDKKAKIKENQKSKVKNQNDKSKPKNFCILLCIFDFCILIFY